ncbi:hypothetical protein ACFLXQ_01460 [Chloroflexota bacterium]
MERIDWQLAIELFCGSDVYYHWANDTDDTLGEYEHINWLDEATTKPTKEELTQAWDAWMALPDYDRLPQPEQDEDDLRIALADRPQIKALMKATPAQISSSVDAMDLQELRNVIKLLLLSVRRHERQLLD